MSSSLLPLLSRAPVDFLASKPDLKKLCLSTLQESFARVVGSVDESVKNVPALQSLHTEGFALIDVWEQLQLINEPLIRHLKKHIKSDVTQFLSEIASKEIVDEASDTNISDEEVAEEEEEEEEEEEKSSEDEGMEELDSDVDLSREVSNEEGGASDCFFDIDKMEEFLNEAEKKGEGK